MKIDFYVLDGTSGQKSFLFACQLLEKIYAEGKKAYVHTNTREEAERFDALLWTYRDDSFIPHQLYQSTDDLAPPIQIGFEEAPPGQTQVLLNLCAKIPAFFGQFQQVIEIVFADPLVQQLARERYKQYRDQGFDITTHKIKANEYDTR